MSFNVQTYPGLAEWLAYDFEGLRSKLYAIRPDWKASGLLDGGVPSLDNIAPGLAYKFLSKEPGVHITDKEGLAMPFRFDVFGSATPLTRDEFIADQLAHAKALRTAILADTTAPDALQVLAADETQWAQGWLAALETAGLLRAADEAPPIRTDEKVMSLNATLSSGILLSKAGDSYRTQADILGFFAKVQTWYGDTARWAADSQARTCSALGGEMKSLNAGAKTSKADLVAALKESFAICDKVVDSMTDAKAAEMVTMGNRQSTRLGALARTISHSNEEYGYMAVYMRLKGIVPPSSEGR